MAALLIVDDDSDVLEALSNVLAAAGYTVERASSGLSALDILDQQKPIDLLLTDVVMPGLHGLNLARMARIRREGLRVLYLSGYTELEEVVQDTGPRLGKLLHKPIAPSDLYREVSAALSAPPAPVSAA
jgi:DNA-binding NtrC family response regulator